MKEIEFFYDYVSPYSYLAFQKTLAWRDLPGVAVIDRPVLLGGIFKATANRAPAEVAAKGVYMAKDLQRLADHYGIRYQFNSNFIFSTMPALRVAMHLIRTGNDLVSYSTAVFEAAWANNVDLSNLEELQQVTSGVVEGVDVAEVSGQDENKEALKAATMNAVERGLFGVPAFRYAGELYWGVDRIRLVEGAMGIDASQSSLP